MRTPLSLHILFSYFLFHSQRCLTMSIYRTWCWKNVKVFIGKEELCMWRERTVQVPKFWVKTFIKQPWLPLNWPLIYWWKIFLLISSFPSSPLIFSTSLTWFSLYFIYFSATPYSTATTATTKKAIDYRIQLLCSICSHVRSIFLTSRPSLTHHQKNIIRFLTHFHNYTQLFTLPSSPQDLARTHTMRRWTDFQKKIWVFLGGLYAM